MLSGELAPMKLSVKLSVKILQRFLLYNFIICVIMRTFAP